MRYVAPMLTDAIGPSWYAAFNGYFQRTLQLIGHFHQPNAVEQFLPVELECSVHVPWFHPCLTIEHEHLPNVVQVVETFFLEP